ARGVAWEVGMVPTLDVVCQGAPAEMGRAQGAALADRIRAAGAALSQIEAFRARRPWWLPYPLYRHLAGRKARRLLADVLARQCPGVGQRFLGLADGAGMGPGQLYLFNALEPLLSSIRDSTACPAACSAVAVRGRRSADGAPVIARNFDYLPVVQPFYSLR